MDSATILVLVLSAGVVALLIWFEINSLRNEASKKQRSTPDQSCLDLLQKKGQSTVESATRNKKAA